MKMGWETSNRRKDLPPNWNKVRQERFKVDGYRCTARDEYGQRCTFAAEECDHIGKRTDHRIEMLRSLCTWHHSKKTAEQGQEAMRKKMNKINQRFRITEKHPGDLS